MKFTINNLFVVSLFTIILTSQISQAQTPRSQPRNNNNNNSKTANSDWANFTTTQTEFIQGCVGNQNPDPAKLKIKQNFCQCALTVYKSRYTPQTFAQINALATQVGKDGPRLVNLMVKPELDRCSAQTNYLP
ncbi:hypothetical protein [Dolichospermum sp. LEGE 00246]|uniref:hypothetical protein n=1 Tax=Dolichospermum sp. LEGE 00246 TaxID=1828605 RepID=UPI00187E9AF6|nr:hypothetical protein [Dolichospermum sp. LEGE 00246]MBE9256973.1 hypothetical protein [Dolichospermum sp. LEGE 00246]